MTVRGGTPKRIGACAVVALLAAATPATAKNWHVHVGGDSLAYSPATLSIDAGDSVTFSNDGGLHNVRADNGSFRCAQGCDGHGGDGDPSDAPWSATVAFAAPGTFGYHCEIHGAPGQGMSGSITVRRAPPPPAPSGGMPAAPVGGVFVSLLIAAALIAAAARYRKRA